MTPAADRAAAADPILAGLIDEYTALRQTGACVDAAAFCAAHPDHADALRQLLPALEMLDDLGRSSPASVPDALGDFRLLRELGRGGMGVVYEAEQISLKRRVAVKVLPNAWALDPLHLQRFRNEAQAAAHLRHPHIVPVYAVGSDRGVHYYAMQLVEGQTLADLIRAPHCRPGEWDSTPARCRAVARLGKQAAEALDHAHRQGLIHRDVKPANLLLDAAGHLWVADFGLARGRADVGVTGSGDLVGTLRYMSPEQASAKRDLVDHRSDVYSLGATLYEALTLRPAYASRDREELLRQIAEADPRPPRKLDAAIPIDLETIVLKAMARQPEDRYPTAQELADDLRRFLEDRPVLARRPSLGARMARMARRHRGVVAAAALALVLMTAGLFAGTVILWNERNKTAQALEQAKAQRLRAEGNFTKALEGATWILKQLDPKPGGTPLQGDRLRQALEEQGINFFRQFIDEANPDPAVRYESGRAYRLLATVYAARQDAPQAQAMLAKAIGLLEALVEAHPREGVYRTELIQTHYLSGLMHTSCGHPEQARPAYARTAELYRAAVEQEPSAELLNASAWFLVDSPDETFRDAARAVSLARNAVDQAPEERRYWNTLGVALYRARDWRGAVEALHRSMALGGCGGYDMFFLAMAHARLGEKPQARAWYEKAVRWLEPQPGPGEDLMRYRREAEALLRD
jgi:tetratricopeptide (TPR) repeat protein/tRNA A-37 threonylcarbamoyl transferase component Bud32